MHEGRTLLVNLRPLDFRVVRIQASAAAQSIRARTRGISSRPKIALSTVSAYAARHPYLELRDLRPGRAYGAAL
jgi:hypothetical protein